MRAVAKTSAWAVHLANSNSLRLVERGTVAPVKSDRKVSNVVQLNLRAARVIQSISAAAVFADLLRAAFKVEGENTSENAICLAAEAAGICGENVARRILHKKTKHASAVVIGRLAIYCLVKGLDPLEVAGLANVLSLTQGRQA